MLALDGDCTFACNTYIEALVYKEYIRESRKCNNRKIYKILEKIKKAS